MSDESRAEDAQKQARDDSERWNEERMERREEAIERIGFTWDGTE